MHRNFLSSPQRRLAVLLLTAFLLSATVASAHPLGNFTINHFTRIEVGSDRVKLHCVIDMAEIPAFQELDRIDLLEGLMENEDKIEPAKKKGLEVETEEDSLEVVEASTPPESQSY